MEQTKQEKRLSKLLLVLAGLFTLALLANVILPLVLVPARRFLQDQLPFVVNSAAKMAALFLLSLNAFINVRRNIELTKILIWIHIVSVMVLVSFAIFAQAPPLIRKILIGGIVMDSALGAVITAFYISAIRSRGATLSSGLTGIRGLLADIGGFIRLGQGSFDLSDIQADTMASLIDAVIPPPEERKVRPEKLVRRFEEFINTVDSAPTELIRTALDIIAPVVALIRVTSSTTTREALRSELQEMLDSKDERKSNAARLLHIMITYLYYSDPEVDSQVGYLRFKQRAVPEADTKSSRDRITVHSEIPDREYDVCIVGSGVAGSLIANRLANQNKSVLVLEGGKYYPEGEATDDEFQMLAHLYKADVFQSALGSSFPVIQAQCVGGGGVVNNAVCFQLPDWVKRDWDSFGAELNADKLKAAFEKIGNELNIRPADQVSAHLNPARETFLRGVQSLGIPHGTGDPYDFKEGFFTVPVNIDKCIGCGYCNLGCSYGRKTNSLKKFLPAAIATGYCDVVAQAKVDSVATSRNGALNVDYLRVRMANGGHIKVRAKKYVLSAGAIASSVILMKSGKIRSSGLPIGERFSANAGSPLHAKFGEAVNAYSGLQITDYFLEKNHNGSWDWIAETWYNPPGTQAQVIPGSMDIHHQRMLEYDKYAAMGSLVGTEAVGHIELNILDQPEVKLTLPDSDIKKLRAAIKRCCEVYFEAGAEEIQLITSNEMILKSKAELSRIDNEIKKHNDFLVLSTGHPMGGNAMSVDRKRGVVDTGFKVHDVDDLYVCDASVFPTSIKVNPQWTVMALAELCAEEILEDL